MNESPAPVLEVAYPQLRALFFAALARLARRGFVVSPDDSMDLVHDFFADAWNDLDRHFDPELGSFERYAYAAFVRFARPRIIRLKRWQNCLAPTEDLDSYPSQRESSAEHLDETRLTQALASLPGSERTILRRFIDSEHPSERLFARELGISRYRLREILVETLGLLAVSLDKPSRIAPQDWEVACALWRDRRTIQEASAVLEMTVQQVRCANSRNFRFLADVLKHYQPRTWSPERKKKMEDKQQNRALETLRRAFQSPGDTELLDNVRVQGQAILKALELSDAMVDEQLLNDISPEWIADVYQAIFESVVVGRDFDINLPPEESGEAHEHEDETIGKAFQDTLIADLPQELKIPPELRLLPEISKEEQEHLSKAPDVLAGRPQTGWWLPYGIRPVTVFYAIESISGLLNRYLRRGRLTETEVVLGGRYFIVGQHGEKELLDDLLRGEISRRTECSVAVAAFLYSWILQVGQRKRWIFKGFEAEPGPRDTLVLTITEKQFEQTYQRWGVA
jgi:RNA polymerase sigma factor (sigma-70 family)